VIRSELRRQHGLGVPKETLGLLVVAGVEQECGKRAFIRRDLDVVRSFRRGP
jgi:hypothetical protein